jgi:hypothetical protein
MTGSFAMIFSRGEIERGAIMHRAIAQAQGPGL